MFIAFHLGFAAAQQLRHVDFSTEYVGDTCTGYHMLGTWSITESGCTRNCRSRPPRGTASCSAGTWLRAAPRVRQRSRCYRRGGIGRDARRDEQARIGASGSWLRGICALLAMQARRLLLPPRCPVADSTASARTGQARRSIPCSAPAANQRRTVDARTFPRGAPLPQVRPVAGPQRSGLAAGAAAAAGFGASGLAAGAGVTAGAEASGAGGAAPLPVKVATVLMATISLHFTNF